MRAFTFLSRGLFAFALLAPVSMITTLPVSAATIAPTTTCSNGVDDTAGLGLICQVTVVNTITGSGGSAKVTIHECHGAAGAPTAACTTTTTSLTSPVTAVTQCNSSINGGGGTLRCSVVVTSNFYGGISPGSTAATVNQCVGTGGAGNVLFACDPFPATTTDAAITQCNGSATGGGASVTCTATGMMASALAVKINQCNGSANGGGALIVCSASLVNNAVSGTPPPTSTVSDGSSNNSTPPPTFALVILLASGGLGMALVVAQRRSIRS
ncbi:MAG: hypothetical protein ABSA21_00020 [Candidatus Limnocylindrales bacterium]|jgi:hypothetical protein